MTTRRRTSRLSPGLRASHAVAILVLVLTAAFVTSALNDTQGGDPGDVGPSAYETWLDRGNLGTPEDFLASLIGTPGSPGISAYELWLIQGNQGSTSDFLASLIGPRGGPGTSAYETWLAEGNNGNATEFIAALT